MYDPVNMQRMAEIQQRDYLAMAEYERRAPPLGSSLLRAARWVIAFSKRLVNARNFAPTQTVTAPDMTEACVEC
jgi:hypothetical protein